MTELKSELSDEFKEYDLYTFSGVKGQTKVGRDGLHYYSSRVTVVFTSPNEKFVDEILQALFKRTTVRLGEMEVVPESVEKENYTEFTETMKYICISPLVLAGPKYGGRNQYELHQSV